MLPTIRNRRAPYEDNSRPRRDVTATGPRPGARSNGREAPTRLLYACRTWAMGGAQSILLTLIRRLPRDRFRVFIVPWRTYSVADHAFAAAAERAGATLTEPIAWFGWSSWSAA